MTKNKPAYFLLYSPPYSSKRSFLSATICVGLPRRSRKAKAGLRLKILRVFSVDSAHSSDPEFNRRGAGERFSQYAIWLLPWNYSDMSLYFCSAGGPAGHGSNNQ